MTSNRQEILIQTTSDNDTIPIFAGHSCEISMLAVNADGTLLASGDMSGKYCLWDIASRQCIKSMDDDQPKWYSQMHSLFEDGGDDEVERLRREICAYKIIVVRLQKANQESFYNMARGRPTGSKNKEAPVKRTGELRSQLEKEGMGVAEVGKVAGEEWRVLKDKSKWEKLADKDKQRYESDMAVYKKK
ncbi:unnamed protein product, partial [Mesorhabditis belari]|uniref:HMG box domain-containing protein n=1 Tax=Mesorhabditis belari TaxID=2138241 RepID=A0AAF3J8V5_9BILA